MTFYCFTLGEVCFLLSMHPEVSPLAIVYRPHYYVPVLGSCVCEHADLSTILECLASGKVNRVIDPQH